MNFSWTAATAQVIVFALIILFFVSLFLFVNRIIKHHMETKASLRRLEEKMEIIMKTMEEYRRS